MIRLARIGLVGNCSVETGIDADFILADLQAARARLDEVVGARTSDDLLQHIFERFCIGK